MVYLRGQRSRPLWLWGTDLKIRYGRLGGDDEDDKYEANDGEEGGWKGTTQILNPLKTVIESFRKYALL